MSLPTFNLEKIQSLDIKEMHTQKELLFMCVKNLCRPKDRKVEGKLASDYWETIMDDIDSDVFNLEKQWEKLVEKEKQSLSKKSLMTVLSVEKEKDDIAKAKTSYADFEKEIENQKKLEEEIKELQTSNTVIDENVKKQEEPEEDKPLQTISSKWWQKAAKQAKDAPLSFGLIKAEKANEMKFPLQMQYDKVKSKWLIALPTSTPPDENCSLAVGGIIQMANDANIELIECTDNSKDADFYNVIKALKGSIFGAYNCLRRDSLSLVENIPKEIRKGWEFALYQAFRKRAVVKDGLDLLHIPKTVTITPSDDTAWLKAEKLRFITDLMSFIKICAEAHTGKLTNPISYFKSEKFIVEKCIGKPPQGGLIHDVELTILKEDYEERCKKCREKLKHLRDWPPDLSKTGLETIYREISSIEKSQLSKKIETAKSSRIIPLTATSGKGVKAVSKIVQGGSLTEKLIKINGGPSVRTIAKVMWSPLTSVTPEMFAANILLAVRCRISISNKKLNPKDMQTMEENCGKAEYACGNDHSITSSAIQCYLDLIEDNAEASSWKTTFGL